MDEKAKELAKTKKSRENSIELLKKEIRDRDVTIGEKEKKIYELKKKNQELEKFKFVLDYKIKELNRKIEPRECEIMDRRDQITEMDHELEEFHKMNTGLDAMIGVQRKKLDDMHHTLLYVYLLVRALVVYPGSRSSPLLLLFLCAVKRGPSSNTLLVLCFPLLHFSIYLFVLFCFVRLFWCSQIYFHHLLFFMLIQFVLLSYHALPAPFLLSLSFTHSHTLTHTHSLSSRQRQKISDQQSRIGIFMAELSEAVHHIQDPPPVANVYADSLQKALPERHRLGRGRQRYRRGVQKAERVFGKVHRGPEETLARRQQASSTR